MKGNLVYTYEVPEDSDLDSYEMYQYGEGQYEIVCNDVIYDTGEADMLGYMPVFKDTSFLYYGTNGYFTVAISEKGNPSFSRLNNSTGKLWKKGIEKYWAMKQRDSKENEV